MIVGTANLYLYCFFGKVATDSFEEMAQCAYDSNWPDIHVDLQKYFVLLIAESQCPIYYHGFQIAFLNLETFLRVKLKTKSFQ